MSEQFPPEPVPAPEEPLEIQPMESISELAPPAQPASRAKWIAPAWFFLGILVGVIGFAAYNTLVVKSGTSAPTVPMLDAMAVRSAARDGTLDAIATLQAGGAAAAQQQQQPQGPQTVEPNAFTVRAANEKGNMAAKVTIVEFADYQCPFCERFEQTVAPELLKQYVDSGKVSFVYKHSAFLGQESIWAAQAAECAADQGKFWEYHDLLFKKQNGENVGTFTKDNLIKYAQELKLDANKFDPCLNNDETLPRVQADTMEGRNAGVSGTPTFFINGKPLVGAQPLQAFQQQLDSVLGQ